MCNDGAIISICYEERRNLVSFPDPALQEGNGLVYIKCFIFGDAQVHVIVMNRSGMATHQLLSRAIIGGYSDVT